MQPYKNLVKVLSLINYFSLSRRSKLPTILQTAFSNAFPRQEHCRKQECVPYRPVHHRSAPIKVMAWRQIVAKPVCQQLLTLFIEAYTHIDGLMQACNISIALAMEILQYCTKPSICVSPGFIWLITFVMWLFHRLWRYNTETGVTP